MARDHLTLGPSISVIAASGGGVGSGDGGLRPYSMESGVSPDVSMVSDVSGLSLADTTHGSVDSGQSEEIMTAEVCIR